MGKTKKSVEELKHDVPAELDEATRKSVIAELTTSYNMEVETVLNYLANSIHLDGMLAQEVKESLEKDIEEELGHARQLARRVKVLGGPVPGTLSLKWEQKDMQPPKKTTDAMSVIKGVIEAETGAITQYQKIIEMTDGVDWVTQDMCIALKSDEEEHRREFVGFLREYEALREMFT